MLILGAGPGCTAVRRQMDSHSESHLALVTRGYFQSSSPALGIQSTRNAGRESWSNNMRYSPISSNREKEISEQQQRNDGVK